MLRLKTESLTLTAHWCGIPVGLGLISFAVVRKLAQPLSAAERQRVKDFANRSVGKRMNTRANIFMADPNDSKLQRLNCFRAVFGPHVERWECLCPANIFLFMALTLGNTEAL